MKNYFKILLIPITISLWGLILLKSTPVQAQQVLKDSNATKNKTIKYVYMPKNDTVVKSIPMDTLVDSVKITVLQQQFMDRYGEGDGINLQSGATVFYTLKMKLPPDMYYALHATIARGTIIKVKNPANGKVVYAKVIGDIPNLKEYNNAILCLSNNAAQALGSNIQKIFTNISY
jgi:hypothetical protein